VPHTMAQYLLFIDGVTHQADIVAASLLRLPILIRFRRVWLTRIRSSRVLLSLGMNTSKHTSIDMSPFNSLHLREPLWPDTLEKPY
jgi:hypothetical protein